MAKLEMQKIEAVALLKDGENIINRLQRRGVVEIYNNEDDELAKISTNASIAGFERSISTAVSALECIGRYCGNKASLLDSLNGRKEISTKKFGELKEQTDKTINLCYSVLEYAKKIGVLQNEIAKQRTAADILKPWGNLDIPRNFSGTKTTRAFIGTFPGEIDADSIENAISERDESACAYAEIVFTQKEQTGTVVICHRSAEDAVGRLLRDMGFVRLGNPSKYTPSEEIELLNREIAEKENKIAELENKIKEFDGKQEDIKFLIDYLYMRRDKYEAVGKLGTTQNTIVINGYIPKIYVDGLVKEFESKYDIAITVTDPSEDDDVPVVLKNGRFSEPVEGITKMYALPNKRDVDPSSVMAFFYYLFFGMMLSDAGYGLLMIIGTTLALKKFTVEGALKKSLRMFRYCGISTLVWGALFGSWFGDLPQVILSNFFGKEIATTALWFEPLDDPIKLLLFSFALGIAHLFLGLGVNFKILWKEGKPFDAFCEVVPIYITILGVAPIAASILTDVPASLCSVGKYMALAGVILIVLTAGRSSKNVFMRFFGGIYGLYNVATGYLSDILSYSRLLALGLATGSIASVINLIASMPQNQVLKAVMLIVVGVVGHAANLGINMLGAYVHSDRLQFVELFSKFYEGGGREFTPFKANTKYIKFEKENIYE